MGIFIRILAIGAALWAVFVHYKTTKNEEQLSKDRIELSACQKRYHDVQAQREIATKKTNSLRDDIRLKQREVQSLRKKLAKKRSDDVNKERQEREKQERAKRERMEQESTEQAQRNEKERAERERMEQERRIRREVQQQEWRIERARGELLNHVTPPYASSAPQNDFGVLEKVSASWSATVRRLIKATQDGDRREIQELVKKLRKTANSADVFAKSAIYTQEAENVIRPVSDVLRAIKRMQELKKEMRELQKKGAHNGEN